ncbi:MAG: hypothetical protein IKQ58_00395 [Prevotella sp.]|nr:hypothetical protein [Prevotella sp.]
MKRIGKTVWFMAVVAVSVLILAACSDGGEHDISDVRSNLQASDATHLFDGIYSGEWSIDHQVVDTAQLVVVGNVLKVRLPESILTELCFGPIYDISQYNAEYLGLPAEIQIFSKGYTNEAVYADANSDKAAVGEAMYYAGASYVTIVDGVTYYVELLSDEAGRTVYKMDTMGWTLAYQVTGFRITDTKTMAWSVKHREHPFTLYYNTKERIR